MTTIALETRGLSKRYRTRGRWALHDLDLRLEAGGVVGLVGPNGAGKSTLLRTWMGFERPTSGAIAVCGLDPVRQAGEAIPHLAYIPQRPALYRDLSIRDHLALAAHYRRGRFDRAKAEKRLDDLGLGLADRVGNISGGQAAQVSLAIAMALRADVLLLDEPLAHLDPLARREFLSALASDVALNGATAILSSHLISDIEMVCDRVVVLADGTIRFHDSVARARATHRVTSSASPGSAGVVAALPGRSGLLVTSAIGDASGEPATLEEIVIGYLAAAR